MDFEQIYRDYFEDVFRYIRRLSGDEQLAEEITSDTFFKAMRAIDRFRGDCDIRVWLCQIAKNCYYNHQKRARRTDSLDEIEIPDAVGSDEMEQRLIMAEDAVKLRMLLHEIPDPYREVFMWRVFAELNFKQIGQIFGKTDNWACVTYHRARKMIKDRMEADGNEK